MKDVIFFSPPDIRAFGNIDVRHIDADMFPLGIAYIASYLRENNFSVGLIDLRYYGNKWQNVIENVIKREAPRFVGIPCVTPTILEVMKISEIVKRINPGIKVVWGGPHPSALPEECMKFKYVDMITIGEGEETFKELISGKRLSQIKGLCYRDKKDKVKINPRRALIQNLDKLPWPAYDMLPLERYGNPFLGKSLIMVTGRGCPYNCAFCSSKVIHQGKYRVRSPKNVVDEIEYLYKKYNVKKIMFVDDTFTAYPQRTMEICKELIRRGIKIEWACDTRVNFITEELLRIMKKAGCRLVKFGVESGDQKILNIIHKGITLEQVRRAVALAKKVGLQTHGFFIIGHPYDTKETIMKTIRFAKELKLDYAQFSVMTPLPGTEVLTMAEHDKGIKLLTKDWWRFQRYGRPVIELPSVSAKELTYYHKLAYRSFYFSAGYIFRRIMHTKISEFPKLVIRAFSLFKFITK
ncbi:MAG: radical SAM protein [Nanoarchaeota archaeon]